MSNGWRFSVLNDEKMSKGLSTNQLPYPICSMTPCSGVAKSVWQPNVLFDNYHAMFWPTAVTDKLCVPQLLCVTRRETNTTKAQSGKKNKRRGLWEVMSWNHRLSSDSWAWAPIPRQAFEEMVKNAEEDMEGRLRVGGERTCGIDRHGCLWCLRGNFGQPQIFCK